MKKVLISAIIVGILAVIGIFCLTSASATPGHKQFGLEHIEEFVNYITADDLDAALNLTYSKCTRKKIQNDLDIAVAYLSGNNVDEFVLKYMEGVDESNRLFTYRTGNGHFRAVLSSGIALDVKFSYKETPFGKGLTSVEIVPVDD